MQAAPSTKASRWIVAGILALTSVLFAGAQTPPKQLGTVKTVTPDGLTLTNAAGQDYTVTVPAGTSILSVPPNSKDLKTATPAQLTDVVVGDRVLVTGSASDTGTTLTARRVIVMKSSAIADTHEQEEAAWAAGGGGIVKTVDSATGVIVVSHGLKPMTVTVTPTTVIKRYSPDSVRAEDAVASSIADIHPGDQLRVRGAKAADGSSITADAILTGTFKNYSGLIASIDATAHTITLKDLATKKTVTVAVTANSDVRRIPPMLAARVAARMHGGAAGPDAAHAPAAPPAGGDDTDRARAGRAGMDLSQMLSRLPTETLAGLKAGDAVMIVATSPSAGSNQATAVTLLAGVESILSASPNGETMTLSPWSVGGDMPTEGGGGGR
jgi:hypothetical protein